jgi:hypothetical protein
MSEQCWCGAKEFKTLSGPEWTHYIAVFHNGISDKKVTNVYLCCKKCAISWDYRMHDHYPFMKITHVSGPDYILGNMITVQELNEYSQKLYKSAFSMI